MKYSVAVVDDHVLLGQAIGGLVNGFDAFETLFLCNNGQDLIDTLKTAKRFPDIVLMDINMPILNGIETVSYTHLTLPTILLV